MKILMMTNTYWPHVGGVALSVEGFAQEYRRVGHDVLIVAPQFEGAPEEEVDVFRIPAIQNFNGSDFSVLLPIPAGLGSALEKYGPDIVHSHHPFLIGDTALRVAHRFEIPLVFTHHTMYEQYTHYVPGDSAAMKRFAIKLSSGYCDLADQVFAPSESIESVLRERGVEAPVAVVPTGVNLARFARGHGPGFRAAVGIPKDAFVVGHLGRLAPEKNLPFLAETVARFMKNEPRAHFLVVGQGPSQKDIREIFRREGIEDRLSMVGVLRDPLLASAYRAMDVFAFASQSETQGMVLTEAMAAGTPVIAVDAPGAREVVTDGASGRLLPEENQADFIGALAWAASMPKKDFNKLKRGALKVAKEFSMERSAEKALSIYETLIEKEFVRRSREDSVWAHALHRITAEWELLVNLTEAAGAAITRLGR